MTINLLKSLKSQLFRSPQWFVIGSVCLFNLWLLAPTLLSPTPPFNDDILHISVLQATIDGLHRSPALFLDPWLENFVEGYPILHAYQPLSALLLGLVQTPMAWLGSAASFYRWSKLLLLAGYPFAIFWGTRRLGLSQLAAMVAAVLSSFVSLQGSYGLDWGSYTWRGCGLYSQLWGAFFLPMAMGSARVWLREGKGAFVASLMGAAATLSHLVYGYVLLASLPLLGLGRPFVWRQLGRRLLALYALIACLTVFFIYPAWHDRIFVNPSVWMPREKFDSYGAETVLRRLLEGELFDAGRTPVLTALLEIGVVVAAIRARFLLGLFLFWLIIYFGRPTFGSLLDILPLSHEIHLHRLIGPIQIFALGLMGVGLESLWMFAGKDKQNDTQKLKKSAGHRSRHITSAVIAITLLIPLVRERVMYIDAERTWVRQSDADFISQQQDLDQLWKVLDNFEKVAPGRVYAGNSNNWGNKFRIGFVPMYGLVPLRFSSVGYLYHAMTYNSDVQLTIDDNSLSDYQLLGIGYVIAPPSWKAPPFIQRLGAWKRFTLYGIASRHPSHSSELISLQHSSLTLVGPREDFYSSVLYWRTTGCLHKDHPRVILTPGNEQLTSGQPLAPLNSRPSYQARPIAGQVVDISRNREDWLIEVVAHEELMLTVAETFHPNWQATVDGVPVKPVMLLPAQLGVPVPPGHHRVAILYRPSALKEVLFFLGWAVWLGCLGADKWRGRRERLTSQNCHESSLWLI